MITPSTSSRLAAEAIPAPSARTARSRTWIASLSPCSSARAQMPLVRRVRPFSFMSLNRSVSWPSCRSLLTCAFHRCPSGIGLHAAAPAAGAARAVHLHDHVPDLTGGSKARPWLAVEDQPAADAGPPEHAEQRVVQPAGPQLELGVGRDLHVVSDLHLAAERLLERRRQRELAFPARQVAGAGHAAVVDRARGADAHPHQRGRQHLGGHRRVTKRGLHLHRHIRRPAGCGRGPPSRAEHVVVLVDDRRLDLRAAEIYATEHRHPGGSSQTAARRPRILRSTAGRGSHTRFIPACRLSSPLLTGWAEYRSRRHDRTHQSILARVRTGGSLRRCDRCCQSSWSDPHPAARRPGSRTATAQSGVVQSTVSGSGNLQAASQLNLGFKTSGTVTHIYITQGEQVVQGQLLATLDPQSAEVTLEQAKASLQSAEANLAKEEETDGEASTGQSSTGASGATAAAAYVRPAVAVARAAATAAGPRARLAGRAHDHDDATGRRARRPQPGPRPPRRANGRPRPRLPASPSKPTTSATTPSRSTSEATSTGNEPVIFKGQRQHGHARSQPCLGEGRREERQADRAER